jgi:hypothetical protein
MLKSLRKARQRKRLAPEDDGRHRRRHRRKRGKHGRRRYGPADAARHRLGFSIRHPEHMSEDQGLGRFGKAKAEAEWEVRASAFLNGELKKAEVTYTDLIAWMKNTTSKRRKLGSR